MDTDSRTGAGSDAPDGFIIRPATVDDVPGIHLIELASFSDPWTTSAFRSMIAQPQVIGAVAEQDARIVGYSIAWAIADEAELANIAVAAEMRGRGVAKRLLDGLLATLDVRGATVYLEVRDSNEAAQALYRSRGFTAAGRRKGYYRRPVEDAVVMRRERSATVPETAAGTTRGD